MNGGGFGEMWGCGIRDGWVMRWGDRVGGRTVDVGDDRGSGTDCRVVMR